MLEASSVLNRSQRSIGVGSNYNVQRLFDNIVACSDYSRAGLTRGRRLIEVFVDMSTHLSKILAMPLHLPYHLV